MFQSIFGNFPSISEYSDYFGALKYVVDFSGNYFALKNKFGNQEKNLNPILSVWAKAEGPTLSARLASARQSPSGPGQQPPWPARPVPPSGSPRRARQPAPPFRALFKAAAEPCRAPKSSAALAPLCAAPPHADAVEPSAAAGCRRFAADRAPPNKADPATSIPSSSLTHSTSSRREPFTGALPVGEDRAVVIGVSAPSLQLYFWSFPFRPHLGEHLLVVPYLSSTPCAAHPSPLMPGRRRFGRQELRL
jgi:hypothetical protein